MSLIQFSSVPRVRGGNNRCVTSRTFALRFSTLRSISLRSITLRGFTLVELLVVVAIIAILASLAVFALLRGREAASSSVCKNNLRQIGLATTNFADAKGRLPYHKSVKSYKGISLLLPYLEQQVLLEKFEKEIAAGNSYVELPPLFHCDTDHEPWPDQLSYLPCGGTNSFVGGDSYEKLVGFSWPELRSFSQVTDGLSNTVFYSERLSMGWQWSDDFAIASRRYPVGVSEFVSTPEEFDTVCWRNAETRDINRLVGATQPSTLLRQVGFGTRYVPNGPSCDYATFNLYPPDDMLMSSMLTYSASSLHDGYVNACFGDGSVRSVSNDIERNVWMATGTIAGAEVAAEW